MATSDADRGIDTDLLRASGALLSAELALGAAIERGAVAATSHDATTLDLLVRLAMAEDNRLRAVELCDQLRLSASHVSRMLDRAEAGGLVERGPDPHDRRAKTVTLTEDGQHAVDAFAPHLHSVLERTVHAVLSPTEVDVLVDLLGRVEQAADELGPAS